MTAAIQNPNLSLFTDQAYSGMAVFNGRGPLITEYLHRTWETIQKAHAEYPRLLAIRLDLHFPAGYAGDTSNQSISRFIDHLKAKIAQDRACAAKRYPRVHDTRLRYVWVREYGESGTPHYHILLLLNKDAYYCLGSPNADVDNLFSRIQSAWASALGLSQHESLGLVHRPDQAEYHIDKHRGMAGLADLFYRASYMCKIDTKVFNDGNHCFGSSRI